ncbi:MAG: PilZ domain-containing protein [Treponema sp.]|nr:PilZ domain-containing protein [Candidatus Treponema equifaecale]
MWIAIFVTAVIVLVLIRLLVVFQDQLKFIINGQDEGFKFNEIMLLWKLAKKTEMEVPAQLYYSVPALNKAIALFIQDSKKNGTSEDSATQDFLTKLYNYRTKIDIAHDNKRGLESTKFLDKGQRLRIILHNKGVFTSEILNNGHEIVVAVPLQKGLMKLDGKEWVGNDISVYLWRKGDAGYVFDTRVTNAGVFNGRKVIYLAQSSQLERAQKRRSVRSECKINGQLYFIDVENIDFTSVEVESGYKCLIEDISEDGAMIRIGGKGQSNIQIKIQFELDGKMIVMFGIIRAVEYNAQLNQSRLHFECVHIDKEMKNAVLNFVYKIIPEDKKEILEALAQTEADEMEDKEKSGNSAENAETKTATPSEPVAEKPAEISSDTVALPEDDIDVNDLAEMEVSDDL